MAFSCSNFGLYNSTYFHGDGCTGINFSRGQSRKGGVEVRGFGFQSDPAAECSLFLKTTTFRASFSVERSAGGAFSKKTKGSSEIRSELQHPDEADSTDTRITIPQEGGDASLKKEACVLKSNYHPNLDFGNGGMDHPDGSGGNGKFPPGRRGGDGGRNDGDHEKNNGEDDEFGPILKFNEVIGEAEKQGVSLPSDMLEDAKTVGIQKVLLLRYLELQASAWPLGFAMKSCSLLRNRMLADPSFLFKVGTEIIIDSCCATFAEVQKRGKDFWAEFELYAADLVVGIVVNVALVGMLAPYARIGQPSASEGYFGCITRAYGALPSSVFEAERPGCRFSVQQRFGTYFYKGLLYGSVGFACGIIGQGIANLIMTAKRSVKKSEEDIPVPPLVKSAALWGVFLAVSSNTRYQIINGLERLVEASPLARRVPPVAMAFTVGVRFANNIYGGMQFVDWARWSGVQGRDYA
uniref:Protein RETICULATA-RELATED 1, chloroplastic n=2 Tax=Elaeis guineensis var. tenera TaxID=51953 RepID=A0A6J0PHI2_ELAGV|nr:protein RETICULATA-RELATED 1, chloroplastic [Elaeis guineensis]